MYLGDNLLRDGIVDLVEAFRRERAGRADPPHPGHGSGELRGGGARRGSGRAAGREAGQAADRPRAGRRLHVHRVDLRLRARDRALGARRARDHRRDPAPGRRRASGRSARRPGLVEGHRARRGPAGGQPPDPGRPDVEGRGRADRRPGSRGASSSSMASTSSGRRCAGRRSSGRDRGSRTRTWAHTRRSARTSSWPAPSSSTRSSCPDRPSATWRGEWRPASWAKDVAIARSGPSPRAYRFVVGDNAEHHDSVATMKVLVTGAAGMLGRDVVRAAAPRATRS